MEGKVVIEKIETAYNNISKKNTEYNKANFKFTLFREIPLLLLSILFSAIVIIFLNVELVGFIASAVVYLVIFVFIILNFVFDKIEKKFPNVYLFLSYSVDEYRLTTWEKAFILVSESLKNIESGEISKAKMSLIKFKEHTSMHLKSINSAYCNDRREKLRVVREEILKIINWISFNKLKENPLEVTLIKNYLQNLAIFLLDKEQIENWKVPNIALENNSKKVHEFPLKFLTKNKVGLLFLYFVIVIPIIFIAPLFLSSFLPYSQDNILLALASLLGFGGLLWFFGNKNQQ